VNTIAEMLEGGRKINPSRRKVGYDTPEEEQQKHCKVIPPLTLERTKREDMGES
jgi:hypothetical protein